jgi:membrane protease YdiL (CAAX protease family)
MTIIFMRIRRIRFAVSLALPRRRSVVEALLVSGVGALAYSLAYRALATTTPAGLDPAARLEPLEVFTAVVAAPVLEETIFRGAILRALAQDIRPAFAVVASALLFSISHLVPTQFVGSLLLGLISGSVYVRSRSLCLCIAVHAAWNAVVYATSFSVAGLR